MKAVMFQGDGKMTVEKVEDARIEQPTDVLIRITSSGICGSDLHMYEGRTSASAGMVMGHENMGVIEECGEGVQQLKEGDRVVVPFNISCGACFNCARGFTNACLTLNPDAPSAAYGYVEMGPYRGGQAELLRVPYGDINCLKLPGRPGDELEDDFLLLSDVFPTGYHGAELAKVQPGSTVAVFGAGPVGLLAAHSALIKGAAEVYVVDRVPNRLALAEKMGAIPIDFSKGNPVEQIRDLRLRNPLVAGCRRAGEEKMNGVMCGIDAVGYQAHDQRNPGKERPQQAIEYLAELVNPTGNIGLVGVYLPEDPKGVNAKAKKGIYELPFATMFNKGLSLGMGQCPVKAYNLALRDLIIAGRAKPSMIVSHRLPLEDAPKAYKLFDQRSNGFTKVILKPTPGLAAHDEGTLSAQPS